MPSLCESCANVRRIRTARSVFLLCELSNVSDIYPKYPRQPVERCDGHRPAGVALLEVPGRFAVCKLPPGAPIPAWSTAGDVFSVTRTADELSIVCRQELVPDTIQAERGWCCLRVAGSMEFTLVGVLASLTAPIAAAGVGVFAVSTFDTDHLFVKETDFETAVTALRQAGHAVSRAAP